MSELPFCVVVNEANLLTDLWFFRQHMNLYSPCSGT